MEGEQGCGRAAKAGDELKASVTVSFDPEIRPQIAGAQFVCHACCDLVRLRVNENGFCITECPHHPSVMIRGNKVMGTSA